MAVVTTKYECTCGTVISYEGDAAYIGQSYANVILEHLAVCVGPPPPLVPAPVINYPQYPTPNQWWWQGPPEITCQQGNGRATPQTPMYTGTGGTSKIGPTIP